MTNIYYKHFKNNNYFILQDTNILSLKKVAKGNICVPKLLLFGIRN